MKPLFGKTLKGNFYNYCPTMRVEGDTLHVWYCTNKISGNITDYIGYRTAKKIAGNWRFSREKIVLGPTKGTWDARHTCDPSVIKGEFRLGHKTYNYLMAYLGCVTDDCKDNENGIAYSERIGGPWIKLDNNPLIPYINSNDYPGPHVYWGYGQPTLVSIDKKGQCLIFYSVGAKETFTRAEHWDFSNLDKPEKIAETRIRDDGYVNIEGNKDVINNADFAYDCKNKVLYATGDMHVRGVDQPTYISNALPVLQAKLNHDERFPLETLFTKSYAWEPVGFIDQTVSGFPKNHNPGILSDIYGWLYDQNELLIGYTVSDLNKTHPRRNGIWQSLHTYRIYGQSFPLQGKKK